MTKRKAIWTILAILVVIILAFILFFPTDSASIEEEVIVARGEITKINTEGAMVDGPYVITISTDGGEQLIAVPSMGINFCVAHDNISNIDALEVGMNIEVAGADDSGTIIPCESTDHYLTVIR